MHPAEIEVERSCESSARLLESLARRMEAARWAGSWIMRAARKRPIVTFAVAVFAGFLAVRTIRLLRGQ